MNKFVRYAIFAAMMAIGLAACEESELEEKISNDFSASSIAFEKTYDGVNSNGYFSEQKAYNPFETYFGGAK